MRTTGYERHAWSAQELPPEPPVPDVVPEAVPPAHEEREHSC